MPIVCKLWSLIFDNKPLKPKKSQCLREQVRDEHIKKEIIMRFLHLTLFLVFFLATSAAAQININTGDVDELTSLPGIGPVKAEAIIKYREENGLFKNIDDLDKVYGIGEKTIARIKEDITVGEAAPAEAATTVNKKGKELTSKSQAEKPVSTKSAGKK